MSHYINNTDVFERHDKIFEAMKLVDNTTVMITTLGTRFEHPNVFASGQDSVKKFPTETQFQKQHKIFVCCQVESLIRMSEFK